MERRRWRTLAEVAAQLKTKIDIMNAHWQDYNRLTTTPNP
jgi:hypothetical protein